MAGGVRPRWRRREANWHRYEKGLASSEQIASIAEMTIRFGWLLALLAMGWAAGAEAQAVAQAPAVVTVIHAGALLAVPGQPPRGRSTIVVRDGRIAEVRDGFFDVPGARLIDLTAAYVLPGLIDAHVHMGSSGDPLTARLEATTNNREDDLVKAIANAAATLQAGFTTVRDLGGYPPMVRALKRGIEEGVFPGPTIVMAARMVSVTAGHGDVNGLSEELTELYRPERLSVCDGVDDCVRATRQQIHDGAEVIKLAATGGVLSNVAGGLGQQMTSAEMVAVVTTAHQWGRKVAAHAHGTDGINAALAAGVDSIEHGTFADDATIALYRRSGAYYVPTLMAPAAARDQGRAGKLPAASAAKAEAAAGGAIKSFARAYREGVKIAFGTDTGVSRHGDNAQEFQLMVAAGMPGAVAIHTATVDAAALLGRADRIGTIEPGRDADIIAVTGDPAADVARLGKIDFVMRRGVVYRAAGAAAAPPGR